MRGERNSAQRTADLYTIFFPFTTGLASFVVDFGLAEVLTVDIWSDLRFLDGGATVSKGGSGSSSFSAY